MNFNKLAKSDKFEYMMLSRLIQDAKYFIEHPDLKHLWTRTLDEHINKMLEQYTKLDPKPEWTSEDEIYELAKQMKESYTNHWNEVHPDNKIEASDNFKVGDKVFFDTLYEFQEDDLGFNYNRGILKEIKHWPSNNREYYIVQTDDGKLLEVGHVFHTEEEADVFRNNWINPKFEKESTITQPTSPKPTAQLPQNMEYAWDPKANQWIAVMKDNPSVTPPTYNPNNIQNQNTTNYMSTVKSSCLSKFLDGPQYSKEIKIEAGLIKEGLVKYAGFDFNRGTKYVITDKGLKFLKAYKEQELNEAQNEREKLAYLFGFNTDEISTLDTTGKVIKSEEVTDEQLEESWNKYYPLYRKDIEAEKITEENYPIDDEVAQHLKLMLKGHLQSVKRYRKAIPIMKYHTNVKMKRAVEDGHSKGLSEDEITKQVDDITEEYYKKEKKIKPTFNSLSENYLKSFVFDIIKNKKSASLNKFSKKWTICEADGTELGEVEAENELDAKVKFGIEHPEYADSQSINAKEIKAFHIPTYLELVKQDYYSGKMSIYEIAQELNDAGYFNYIPTEEQTRKFLELDDTKKEIYSQYEQTTETHEPYPNPSETPHDDIVLENHDGWVNTAGLKNKSVYRKLFILAKMLEDYRKKELIWSTESEDDNIEIITGDAKVINELEHKIKDLGFYCESVLQSESPETGLIYSLKIFLDEE